MNRGGRDAAARFAERRRVEDEAPRLKALVPNLTGCRIEFAESRAGSTSADVVHARPVVVDVAPAHFFVPCADSSCRDGGHDITSELVRGLQRELTEIRGEDTCYGHVGTADCGRVLRYRAFAEYRKPT